jgi:hypothetical protein
LLITTRPLWKIFTTFKTFHLGRSPITIRPLWKNLCIYYHFEKSLHFSQFWKISVFHLGRSPITIRPP